MNQWLKDYGTIAVTVATAIGYGVGYSTLALFARELGVSIGDLDADLRDYLLLAGINIATWMVALLVLIGLGELLALAMRGIEYLSQTHKKLEVLGFPLGGLLIASVVATFFAFAVVVQYVSVEANTTTALDRIDIYYGSATWLTYGAASVFAAVPFVRYGLVSLSRNQRLRRRAMWKKKGNVPAAAEFWRHPVVLITWTGLIVIMSTAVTLVGSVQWARDIKKWGAGGEEPSGPVGLSLILQPERGEVTGDATVEGDRVLLCVVRVSERVLAGTSVIVTEDVKSFEAGCL